MTKEVKTLINILPPDIREVAGRVIKRCSIANDWEMLAQFCAAHNSFRHGLLPKNFKNKLWTSKKVVIIFKAGDELMNAELLAMEKIEKAKVEQARFEAEKAKEEALAAKAAAEAAEALRKKSMSHARSSRTGRA